MNNGKMIDEQSKQKWINDEALRTRDKTDEPSRLHKKGLLQ